MLGRLLLSLALILLALPAQAVRIDDRDVMLDSGKTLEQAIIDGDIGGPGAGGDSITVNGVASTNANFIDSAWVQPLHGTSGTPNTIAFQIVSNAIGSTEADELAIVLAANALQFIVDANPAEAGSWTAGIEEAANRLPSTGGIVQLRCNQTYTFAARASWDDASGVDLSGQDDVWIRGCGASTVVTHAATSGQYTYMFKTGAVGGTGSNGSDRLRFSDFEVRMTDSCASGCTTQEHVILYNGGLAADVLIDRMRFVQSHVATSDTSTINESVIYIDADYGEVYPNVAVKDRSAVGWRIQNSYFSVGANGIQSQLCEQCSIVGNSFEFGGRPINDNSPVKSVFIRPKGGRGYVITGNQFDFGAMDGDTGAGGMNTVGISHAFDFNPTPTDPMWANGGATISGNTFTRMRGYYLFGIELYGVDNDVIAGNNFQQGYCSAGATYSCTTFEDCVGHGGGTCLQGGSAVAVYFNPQPTNNQGWLRGHLVESNVFNGWDDDDGDQCPIYLGTSGTDPDETTSNVIRGNVMRLLDSTDDGLCGDATKIATNIIDHNYVVGAATECLEGQTTTGCSELITHATKVIRYASPELATPKVRGVADWNDLAVDNDDCALVGAGVSYFDSTDGAFEFCQIASGTPVVLGGSGSGETNTASNLGGGLANFSAKVGVDLQFNSFAAADFDLVANLLSIDDTKWATDAQVAAGYQPLDSDLTSIAAVATAAFGRSLLSQADAPTARANLGLIIGSDVQGFDLELADLADGNLTFSVVGGGTANRCVRFGSGGRLEAHSGDCGSGGSTTGTTNTTWTVDDDNTAGTEPANGAGIVIEGGSGDVSLLWDAALNRLVISGPAGTTVGMPDAGDGLRGADLNTNTSAIGAGLSSSPVSCKIGFVGTTFHKHCNGGALTSLEGGAGENTSASGLGGGLAIYSTEVGDDLRFNTVAAADFDLTTNLITIDATKWATLAAVAAAYQPLDSDLTAIAALTTTTAGRALLDDADAAAQRTTLGLVIGTDVQAQDSDLASIAALTTTAFGRGLLDDADAAAARTSLGLGTMAVETAANYLTTASAASTYQPLDGDLTSIAALTTTAFGRGLLDDADAAAGRASLGMGVFVCDFAIEAPVSGDDGIFQCYVPVAATINRVYCNATTGTSVVQLYERAEATPSTGTTELLTGDLTCDTDGASTTSFADAAIAADSLIALGLQTTFTAGVVRVHVEYTLN